METFTDPKELVANPRFDEQRRAGLATLSAADIDVPIIDVITEFNRLPFCFSLQCCFGHFLPDGQTDEHNLEQLPVDGDLGEIEYRIAYLAFCLENSAAGRDFFESLKEITKIDPEYVQLGSADWFWDRQVNTYALQVEPDRFKHQDTAVIGGEEARHIEKIRNEFFVGLRNLLDGMTSRGNLPKPK